MERDILVDGYNVIKNNVMFQTLVGNNFSYARELLVRQLKNPIATPPTTLSSSLTAMARASRSATTITFASSSLGAAKPPTVSSPAWPPKPARAAAKSKCTVTTLKSVSPCWSRGAA